LRTATVASTPITRKIANRITAMTRSGITHLAAIVYRTQTSFGDISHHRK
jgi:hypothetical protein